MNFFPVSKQTIVMQNFLLFRRMPPLLKNTNKEYFVASVFYIHKNKTRRCIKKVLKQVQSREWLVMSQNVSSKMLFFNTQLVLRWKSFWKTMDCKLTVQLWVLKSIMNAENWVKHSLIERKIWICSRFLAFAIQRVPSKENYFLPKQWQLSLIWCERLFLFEQENA